MIHSVFEGFPLLQAANGGGTGQLITTFITFGMVFLIFYFLIIRPQNKKQKETKEMLSKVKKGDKVQTIGGIRGVVYAVKDDSVVIKVDDDTKIEFVKSAVAAVLTDKADKAEKSEKTEKIDKQEKETETSAT
jgi:preprotein translocase subunit YajC